MTHRYILEFCAGMAAIMLYQSSLSSGQTTTCHQVSSDYCTCEYTSSSKSGTVSLKSIANVDGTPRWEDQVGTSDPESSYSYNPCYPFNEHDCGSVAVCQAHQGDYFSLGTQSSVSMKVDNQENVVFTYSETFMGVTRNAIVTLICEPQTKNAYFVVDGEQTPVDPTDPNRDYKFEVHGEVSCPTSSPPEPPPSKKKSLSPGSIMCIVFFVLLIVYVVAGILYNKYRRGAGGKELIPNVEFWSDLPFLVKDGVLFVIKPCRKSGEYEQM